MAIGSIGQVGNFAAVSSSYSSNVHKAASDKIASAGLKKDSANISEAAKELAAQKAGTTSQEEATESASAKLQEQLTGAS